jgi:hypothetical protein
VSAIAAGRGLGGNREVPPVAILGGAEASLEEGGTRGKHGFPRGTEAEAEDAAMERSQELAAGES